MSLDNSERREDGVGGGGPLFSPLGGLEPLHRHQEEAARQHLLTPLPPTWQQQARLTWDLVAALWGRLDSQVRMMGPVCSSSPPPHGSRRPA